MHPPRSQPTSPSFLLQKKKQNPQDLEFVQALANPHYVAWLGAAGLFADPAFMAYLRSLDYWRHPSYSVFLSYPAGLAILDLLVSSAAARTALARPDVADWVAGQQYWQWKSYWGHRGREGGGHGGGGQAAAEAAGAGVQPS
jgi:hypothetical protein